MTKYSEIESGFKKRESTVVPMLNLG